MSYYYRLFWKEKLTWVLVAALLLISAFTSYFYPYRMFILDGDFFSGSAVFAGQAYETYFFFRATDVMHVPVYALWIYAITRFFMDVKYCTRTESRARWLMQYLRISALLAVTYLAILNIPALVGSYVVGGVFLPVLPYYLYSFVLEFMLHMILSLLYFLVYLLTERSFVAFIAVVLYGVWDDFYSLIYVKSEFLKDLLDELNLFIGWARAVADSTYWTEDRMLDWSSFFMFAGIFLLLFALCQIAIRRKDFLSAQESAQKA